MRESIEATRYGFVTLAAIAIALATPATAEVLVTELRVQGPVQTIELFNTGPTPVALDDLGINILAGSVFPLGIGENIGPGQFKLITLPGPADEAITIRSRGDCIELFDTTFQQAALDRVDIGDSGGAPLDVEMIPQSTIARVNETPDPSGGNSATFWTIDFTGTLGAPNNAPPPQLGSDAVINEVIPNEVTDVVVEIFNPSNQPRDLNGWVLTTGLGQLNLSGVVGPQGFATFNFDPVLFNYSLNVYLTRADQVRIDQLGLTDDPFNQGTYHGVALGGDSFQRVEDGAGSNDGFDLGTSGFPITLQVCQPTPGTPNAFCGLQVPAAGLPLAILAGSALLGLGCRSIRRESGRTASV